MTINTTFAHFPALATQRLRFREIELRDAKDLFAVMSDEETMQYYGPVYRTLAEAEALIVERQADYAARREIRWGITLEGEDRVIGTCGFHHFDEGYHRAETGYILNKAFWGQGIMSEAVSAIVSYGFDEMGFHRIEAIIDIANERSRRLLLKLGFQYEGNLRQRYVLPDGFADEHYFGLLRDEWQPR